jgi:deferrochelatase/peroxidase EfeB
MSVEEPGHRLTRRGLLVGGGAVAGGLALDRLLAEGSSSGGAADAVGVTEPFFGEHQAGIATAAQQYLYFAAFDLVTDSAVGLRELLEHWTLAAQALTCGQPVGPVQSPPDQPPADPGEAVGLQAARLTVTFGLGPGVFESSEGDRFGFARRRPASLRALPPVQGESFEPERSGGDVCVQACAEDPQVAFHAVRARDYRRLVERAESLPGGRVGLAGRRADEPAQRREGGRLQRRDVAPPPADRAPSGHPCIMPPALRRRRSRQ